MATQDDVRTIACRLPGVVESPDSFAFSVPIKGKLKGFVWAWAERVHPKKARIPNPGVVAVTVRYLTEKDILIGADPQKFFTEPHYNGFPAILVRLEAIGAEELEDLIVEAWSCKATPDLLAKLSQPQ